MQNKAYRVSRRRKHGSVWPVFFVIVAAVALALLISGAWQVAEGKPFFPPASDMLPPPQRSVPESAGDVSQSESGPPQDNEVSGAASESGSEPELDSEPEPVQMPVFDGAVPASDAVGQEYFDDAVFVGDSITEGMTIYNGMSNAAILAYSGINFSTIRSAQVMKQEDGARTTIMEELGKKKYGKVYVMLGGNEVKSMDKDTFLAYYEKLLDEIRAMQPDAVFYVQSMTPVTENNNYQMNNPRIDDYNQGIMELCGRKGFYFLNVAESMKDERGMLPTEASPKDGLHFGQAYFDKWIAYLKTHTVGPAVKAAEQTQAPAAGESGTEPAGAQTQSAEA